MLDKNKITIESDAILYDRDQIAFEIDNNKGLCLCLSQEDLRNAEMNTAKVNEILSLKQEIKNYIVELGYSIIEE